MKRKTDPGSRLFQLLALLSLTIGTGLAAPIQYTFDATTRETLNSPSHAEHFQLIVPDFLPVLTGGDVLSFTLSDPALLSCVACTDPPLPTLHFLRSETADVVQFSDADGILRPYFFPAGALTGRGPFDTLPGINVNVGRLAVAETPEPSTVALVIAGVALFVLRLRRVPSASSGLVAPDVATVDGDVHRIGNA